MILTFPAIPTEVSSDVYIDNSKSTWNWPNSPRRTIAVRIETVFSCDQAALRTLLSFCLSVRPSVRPSVTPFSLCSHHRIIMKFAGVITNVRSDTHAKGQCQITKVKVTEVKTQFSGFWTVTLVWIHKWWWNDAQGLMWLRRGVLLFFKVIRHGTTNRQFWPKLSVSGL